MSSANVAGFSSSVFQYHFSKSPSREVVPIRIYNGRKDTISIAIEERKNLSMNLICKLFVEEEGNITKECKRRRTNGKACRVLKWMEIYKCQFIEVHR